MSLRNLRKIRGGNTLPKPDDSSEDEYQPLSRKNNEHSFACLAVSSSSNSACEEEPSELEEAAKKEKRGKKIKKVVKKKKKMSKKTRRLLRKNSAAVKEEMDEIDKSVMEVNAILGKPRPHKTYEELRDIKHEIFAVNLRHINVSNEMDRKFGPDTENPDTKRNHGREPNLRRIHKQIIIPPDKTMPKPPAGILMRLMEERDGVSYFAYEHSTAYRDKHYGFLLVTDHRRPNPQFLPEDHYYDHIEFRLDLADFFFYKEEYTIAIECVETVVHQLHTLFHQSFRLNDSKVRLLYEYVENRPFHIAFLKYAHLLSNKACHRTALEIVKMLLNMDPSDPLGVLFVIDTFAIRAREYEWVVKAIDYWYAERGGRYMFNMVYSYALAKYHLSRKKDKLPADAEDADILMEKTILQYPNVTLHLLKNMNSRILNGGYVSHPLFTLLDEGQNHINKLQKLYAKFLWPRWREPEVLTWFEERVLKVIQLYDSDEVIRNSTQLKSCQNILMFRSIPIQIQRYLCVIHPMSNLLLDGGGVPLEGSTRLTDPFPDASTIDRHGYAHYSSCYPPELRDIIFAERYPGVPRRQRLATVYYQNEEGLDLSTLLNSLLNSLSVGAEPDPPNAAGGAANQQEQGQEPQ